MSEVTDKAQELLNGRLDSVRSLEQHAAQVRAARDQLATAERAEADAWSAATSAGWTSAELKRLGFSQPATRRGGRPRSTTRRRESESGNS